MISLISIIDLGQKENLLKEIDVSLDDKNKIRFNLYFYSNKIIELLDNKFAEFFMDGTGFRLQLPKT
ncbi:MAG: hypothetical protein GY932_11790 [Arcobacter sp.]|nr:hypothetical protein [Arcobacter sp.]